MTICQFLRDSKNNFIEEELLTFGENICKVNVKGYGKGAYVMLNRADSVQIDSAQYNYVFFAYSKKILMPYNHQI